MRVYKKESRQQESDRLKKQSISNAINHWEKRKADKNSSEWVEYCNCQISYFKNLKL